MSAGFRWTGSTHAGFQEFFRADEDQSFDEIFLISKSSPANQTLKHHDEAEGH